MISVRVVRVNPGESEKCKPISSAYFPFISTHGCGQAAHLNCLTVIPVMVDLPQVMISLNVLPCEDQQVLYGGTV